MGARLWEALFDIEEDDIDDGFRRLFAQLAGEVPQGASNYALVVSPQDAEISAFELQTILRRVLAKREYPLIANLILLFPLWMGGDMEILPLPRLAAVAKPCPSIPSKK
ncbi:hypothetical protein P7K49_036009 [Saguinus oedipus]|uniref:Uncharacterized protein n=1 Tax=Saguinus oedipus TaxID=9490 RepID=A0ABQ9TP85_SAGOE|nr:hypothetical protein P7K49_036009 [Saguinus oedipus]